MHRVSPPETLSNGAYTLNRNLVAVVTLETAEKCERRLDADHNG